MGRKKNQPITFAPSIVVLNKPSGISSAGFLNQFKRCLPEGIGKIGHFGTLDPFANGVLLVGFAGAARLANLVHDKCPKTYLAHGTLGVFSPTGDLSIENEEIEKRDWDSEIEKLSVNELNDKFRHLVGRYLQKPPAFSAVKVDGKRSYELARKGVDVDNDPVERTIHSLEIVEYQFPKLVFRCTVSTGTYIRTLFEDMAKILRTSGALSELCRESVGMASLKMGIGPEDVAPFDRKNPVSRDTLLSWVTRPTKLLEMPQIELREEKLNRFFNGNDVESECSNVGPVWVLAFDQIVGVGQVSDNGKMRPEIVFPQMINLLNN